MNEPGAANGGVDAAARFHSAIARPIILRNTLAARVQRIVGRRPM
jgi:hypothetical protein